MPELNARVREIPMPDRIRKLPVSPEGFPVPWFVAWMNEAMTEPLKATDEGARPDFRVVKLGAVKDAYTKRLCWVCGEPLGQYEVCIIGPMCSVNRVTSEPGSHQDCAQYAAQACPFLTQPRAQRNKRDLPDDVVVAGNPIQRNPGVTALWVMHRSRARLRPFRAGDGTLFRLPDNPDRVEWWTQGRKATREEVLASIESGLPILCRAAEEDGPEAMQELYRLTGASTKYLPAAA